ncbi:ABC transporter permease [Frateuria terrea]|uniref:Putative ABC transport system permease protein n=1 Tax=Frateuria terrea TaxID=529704 RepID=A0A1H6RFL0_9GAMM|nr:FtsX-like permease family protein [Frateuria terrea]SEI50385.1 putative ABC transport system permease protein [Frateuria terrea]SFP15476.1 putative ABC transport system permease protein [Frateuria terrea]
MQIKPILAALKRHKAGTVLIALQIALTLAIVCNALFIIQQRVSKLVRPTGVAESEVLTVQNSWVGADDATAASRTKTDLLALRGMPGVRDASFSNSYPLRGGGMSLGVKTDPDVKKPITGATIYYSDDHSIDALGAKLIAGRNFLPQEIRWVGSNEFDAPAQVIISKALAHKVYPDGSALGKPIYLALGETGGKPSTVVGIVERLQVPWSGNWASNFVEYSVLVPYQSTGAFGSYIIRAKPGQLDALTKAVPALLFKTNRMRVIPAERGVRTFAQVRDEAYKSDRGMAILMGVVCAVLLAITAAGIVGLTSFWVGQRRKQIGVRRALGATKHDILSYFLTENLLIGAGGVIVGAALAIGMNLWLVSHFEMERLSLLYVVVGVVALLLLGQGAVLAPAMKASRVPPVEATRSV